VRTADAPPPPTEEEIQQLVELMRDSWYPSDLVCQGMDWLHHASGLSHGLTVVSATLFVRFLLAPLFVNAQRNSSRMAHMKPEMDVLKTRVDAMAKGVPDPATQARVQAQMKALFAKYDCNPLKSLLLPVIQLPLFISFFFGLQKMPELFGSELSTGGMLWFTDLTVSDPYVALPVLSAMTFLATIEVTKAQTLAATPNPKQGQMMINFMRGMGVVMVPLTMNFPGVIFVYWVTNNTFSLVQTIVLQQPDFRKSLGIWEPPKPVPGQKEAKGMVETLQDMVSRKSDSKTKDNELERIKNLNAEVDRRKAAQGGRKRKGRKKQ